MIKQMQILIHYPSQEKGRPKKFYIYHERRCAKSIPKTRNFLELDEYDLKILHGLAVRSVEFSTLELVDQKVLVWFLIHQPSRVVGWTSYVGNTSLSFRVGKLTTLNAKECRKKVKAHRQFSGF